MPETTPDIPARCETTDLLVAECHHCDSTPRPRTRPLEDPAPAPTREAAERPPVPVLAPRTWLAAQTRRRPPREAVDCRPTPDGRLLHDQHLRDCNASGCPGCKPCPDRHCTVCRHDHLDDAHPRVCPRCVGRTREDLLTIVERVDEAHRDAVHRSTTSATVMVAGPAADYEAASYIRQAAMSGALCRCARRGQVCPATIPDTAGPVCGACVHPSCRDIRRHSRGCPDTTWLLERYRDDDQHPMTVLGGWDLTWRRALGHGAGDRPRLNAKGRVERHDPPTLETAQGYLLRQLTYMAQVDPEVADFAQFADEVRACRTWLDQVLNHGERTERGELCPACGKRHLVRSWEPTDHQPYTPGNEHIDYADGWCCPNPACGQTWTDEEYQYRVQGIYVGVAPALTASQIRTQYRVLEGTVRKWAARGKVARAGRDGRGRQLYVVADVLACRDADQPTTRAGA